MQKVYVWDPLIRLFHWSLVAGFTANALVLDDESKAHEWVGYAIGALLVLRVAWGFAGPQYARFSSFLPSASGCLSQLQDMATGRRRIHPGHSPLGALMIYNLLAALLVIIASGMLMTTDALWGVEWPEEVHEAAVTWAEISVAVHILAVLLESLRLHVNLPRSMISGYKSLPDNGERTS